MSRLYANSVIFKFISEKNTEWIGNQYGVTLDRKLTSGQVILDQIFERKKNVDGHFFSFLTDK